MYSVYSGHINDIVHHQWRSDEEGRFGETSNVDIVGYVLSLLRKRLIHETMEWLPDAEKVEGGKLTKTWRKRFTEDGERESPGNRPKKSLMDESRRQVFWEKLEDVGLGIWDNAETSSLPRPKCCLYAAQGRNSLSLTLRCPAMLM